MFANILLRSVSKHMHRYYSSLNKTLSISQIMDIKKAGENIKIQGWVKSLRKMKGVIFLDVSDGSCDSKLQVVISQSQKPADLTTGASVVASGVLALTQKGQLELSANTIHVSGKCIIADGYPFAPRKTYPPDYVRQFLHFRPRTNKFSSLLRVRNCVAKAIHDYLQSEGFINVHTPILTSNDCEDAGEVFKVSPDNAKLLENMIQPGILPEEAYFNSKVYLTVSGQLHLEAVVHGLSKVYSFGPIFRAENSRSRFHLSEFYMLEAEMAFTDKIEQLIDIIEKLITNVCATVLDESSDDIKQCQDSKEIDLSWVNKKFTVLTYDEAVTILNKNKEKCSGTFNENLGFSKEHEIFLVSYCGGVPTFIINWPKNRKPFYMRECQEDSSKVAALDLLAPGIGEIVGGSLRENDWLKLEEKLPEGKNDLKWYLEIRKFGGVPTGGFGLGFERFLQLILSINNVKDTIPFPRWPHNCNL